MKPMLTVFTPTYNRGYTIHKCYESLKRQTNKNFVWLVIDDGSTDNTRQIIDTYIKEGIINIKYIYQQNQGMHGAHNTAYENIDTELNVCIDSDDYMTNDAVEKILKFWEENKSDDLAGIMALDAYDNGNIIGDKFPEDMSKESYYDVFHKYKISGDKKLIYRTDISKKYPYPIFEGENYVGLDYKYNKIDLEYKIALMNEIVCIVEYLEDGSSRNMFKQYMKNPKGFSFYRIEAMKHPNISFKDKVRENIHYISSSILSKNYKFIKESPCKFTTITTIPIGIMLYLYIILINKYTKN